MAVKRAGEGSLLLFVDVGKTALATVDPVGMSGHKDTSTAGISWTLPPQPLNFAVSDLVVLENSHLNLLMLVLDLLRLGICLLLPLLPATQQASKGGDVGQIRDAEGGERGRVGGDILTGMDETEGIDAWVQREGFGVEIGGSGG